MNKNFLKLVLLLLVFVAGAVRADVPSAQHQEVAHLLSFIKISACTMIRNGQRHDAVAALSHIQKKYDYFRDKISTTEDFIELSASKSTLSGKYYTVKCDNHSPVRSRDWLLQELKRYRKKQKSGPDPGFS